jgi:hypothetical protein
VAGIAFSAMIASSASAAEYGQCKLLSKETVPKDKHGVYSDPNCQVPYSKKGKVEAKGNYEWYPGPSPDCVSNKKGEYTESACVTKSAKAKKGKFERVACYPNCNTYTSKTGKALLSTPGLGASEVECTKGTGSGEITGVKSGTTQTTFTNCTTDKGASTCTSEGAPSETIVTYELNATVIGHGEKGKGGHEPVTGEVWTEFSGRAPHAKYLAIFDCVGVAWFAAEGTNAGVQTGNVNVMTTIGHTEIHEGQGEQQQVTTVCDFNEFEAAGGCKHGAAGPSPSLQEVAGAESVGVEANEIKTEV